MRYMLQVRFNRARAELAKLSEAEQQAVFAEYAAVGKAAGVLAGVLAI